MDLGFFVGPLLGSVVYEHTNYAFMFKMSAVPVALALICFIVILPVYKKRRRELAAAEA
jgi:predicted MFS family arabinose efflux permease